MKHSYPLLVLVVLFAACRSNKDAASDTPADSSVALVNAPAADQAMPTESPDNFVIIPGQQVGAVRPTSTEASLKELLGPELVVRDTVYMGEGEFDIGTTVFKNTADQIQILWKDKKAFAKPEIVFVRPAYDENSELRPGTAGKIVQWVVSIKPEIGIGTSLKDVEKANGKPFKLYGFGWDYGGTSAGWEGGKLQAPDGKSYLSVLFGFDPAFYETESKLYESVLGDSEFPSSNAAMQALNPIVKSLTISF